MYSETLLDYFYHLDHVGQLQPLPAVYFAEEGAEVQGDRVALFIQVAESRILQACFQCYGGVALLAACEYVCRTLEGKTLQEASYLTVENVLSALGLSRLHIHTANRVIVLIKKVLPL